MLKKVLALVLVLTLSLGLSAVAFAADEPMVGEQNSQTGNITGETEVVALAIRVVVPTKIVLGIDPYERKSEAGNQIFNPIDFPVINKSDVDVKVKFDLTASNAGSAATNTKYVQDVADVTSDDATVTAKVAYFAAMVATSGTTSAYDSASPGVTAGFDPSNEDSLVVFDATGKTDFSLVLGKADLSYEADGTTIKDSASSVAADGYSAFRFYSKLNSYATWSAGDLMVSGTYTITALGHDNYIATEKVDDTMGLAKAVARIGFADSSVSLSKSRTTNTPVNFNFGELTVSSVKLEGVTPTAFTDFSPASADYSYDKDEGTFTFVAGAGRLFGGAGTAGTYKLHVTLSDNRIYSINITITA